MLDLVYLQTFKTKTQHIVLNNPVCLASFILDN